MKKHKIYCSLFLFLMTAAHATETPTPDVAISEPSTAVAINLNTTTKAEKAASAPLLAPGTKTSAPIQLTLELAMDLAENFSYAKKLAMENQNGSKALEGAATLGMLPNVSGTFQYLKYDTQVNAAAGTQAAPYFGMPINSTVQTGSLTLTQPIVGLAGMLYNVRSLAAQTRAAAHLISNSKNDARFLGAQAFINAQTANQLVSVAKYSVEVAISQLKDAEAQYHAGTLTRGGVLQFKLNLENAKATLISADTTNKVAVVTLAETLGIQELNSIQMPEKYVSVFANKNLTVADSNRAVLAALEKRPDLLALKENIVTATNSKYASETSYLPTVNFIATYSRNFQAPSMTIQTAQGPKYYSKDDIMDTLYYGVQLNWNLLDWGVRQQQITAAVSKEQQARISKEQLESQIKIDATQSYLQLKGQAQVLDSASASVQYAKDVYSQVRAQFKYGQATSTDLITAFTAQTSALANFANATGTYDLAWLTLKRSMGGTL